MRYLARDPHFDQVALLSLKEMLDNVMTITNSRRNQNNIETMVEGLDSDILVPFNRSELSHVMLNLVQNSMDAIIGSGSDDLWIKIIVEESRDIVKLHFADSGNGIPREIAEQIFNPFYTTKQVGEGAGLGLSVSHGIMEANGGGLKLVTTSSNTHFVLSMQKFREGCLQDEAAS